MNKRLHQTAADYAIIAICPALIIVMLTALVHFLVLCVYQGQFVGRLMYILFLFIVAATLIARIAIENSRSYAAVYAIALGAATFIAINRFVQLSGPMANFSFLFNTIFIVIIWWLADRVTFDCTVIDDAERSSGEGLLDSRGLFGGIGSLGARRKDKEPTDVSLDGTSGSESESVDSRALPNKRKGHQPGRWVLYLAVAALPLFGLGQLLLPDNPSIRSAATRSLGLYLFGTLTLLVTTSFLGLRRYLRQRGTEMPAQVSVAWLAGGAALTAILLLVAFVLPLPGHALASFQLPEWISSPDNLNPSRYGWGNEGTGNSTPDAARTPGGEPSENEQPASANQAAGGENGPQSGAPGSNRNSDTSSGSDPNDQNSSSQAGSSSQSGSSGSQDSGESSNSQSGQSGGSESQSGQSGSNQEQSGDSSSADQNSQSSSPSNSDASESGQTQSPNNSNQQNNNAQSRSEAGEGQPQPQNSESNQQSNNQQSNNQQSNNQQSNNQQSNNQQSSDRQQANDNQPQSSDSQPSGQPSQSSNSSPTESDASDSQRDSSGSTSSGSSSNPSKSPSSNSGSSWNLNLGSWLTPIIKFIVFALLLGVIVWFVLKNKDLLAAWFQGLFSQAEDESPLAEEASKNTPIAKRPFTSFQNPLNGDYTANEAVITTFQAFEAWGRERGIEREEGETPTEYAWKIQTLLSNDNTFANQVIEAYNRVVYGRGSATRQDVSAMKKLWAHMAAH